MNTKTFSKILVIVLILLQIFIGQAYAANDKKENSEKEKTTKSQEKEETKEEKSNDKTEENEESIFSIDKNDNEISVRAKVIEAGDVYEKEVNGIKETIYQCPVNNTTERAIAQDNGAICTCDNKHEQVENLKKVLMATAMADAIRTSACGKNDDEDNKTLSNIQERRKECQNKKGTEYEACMNKPFP